MNKEVFYAVLGAAYVAELATGKPRGEAMRAALDVAELAADRFDVCLSSGLRQRLESSPAASEYTIAPA